MNTVLLFIHLALLLIVNDYNPFVISTTQKQVVFWDTSKETDFLFLGKDSTFVAQDCFSEKSDTKNIKENRSDIVLQWVMLTATISMLLLMFWQLNQQTKSVKHQDENVSSINENITNTTLCSVAKEYQTLSFNGKNLSKYLKAHLSIIKDGVPLVGNAREMSEMVREDIASIKRMFEYFGWEKEIIEKSLDALLEKLIVLENGSTGISVSPREKNKWIDAFDQMLKNIDDEIARYVKTKKQMNK